MRWLLMWVIWMLATTAVADWLEQPFVHSKGIAQRDVPPEKASLRFSVLTFDQRADAAMTALEAGIANALAVLRAHGIPDAAIVAHNLHRQMQRTREDRRNTDILGYELSRSFEVTINDLSLFAELVDNLHRLDHVNSVNATFDVNNRDAITSDLLREAAADARLRAAASASALDVQLGAVLAVSPMPISRVRTVFGADTGGLLSAQRHTQPRRRDMTVLIPTHITISTSVHVAYALTAAE